MKSLDINLVSQCTKCIGLGKDHVPASGNPSAEIMFVGQSPGALEVEHGSPFVGPSGELVDFLLDEAGLSRDQVYITNAIKCRPPGNRPGNKEELNNCYNKWLKKEIKFVNPKVIVLLGKDAWKTVTKEKMLFGHQQVKRTKKRVYLVLYHPSFFLRRGDIESFVGAGKILRTLYG